LDYLFKNLITKELRNFSIAYNARVYEPLRLPAGRQVAKALTYLGTPR